jgi:hypothetical protein
LARDPPKGVCPRLAGVIRFLSGCRGGR